VSLINEALKRTHERSVPAGYAISAPPADYHVTTPARPARRKAATGRWLLGVGLAAAGVAAAVAVMLLVRQPPAATAAASDPAGAVSAAPTKPAVEPRVAPVAAVVPDPKVNEDQVVSRVLERLEKTQAEVKGAATASAVTTVEPAPAPVAAIVPAGPAPLVLQGISRYAGVYEAMINNSTVKVGEEIDGARVLAIEARAVRLSRGGEEVTLRLR
jgi:hypothetical protein